MTKRPRRSARPADGDLRGCPIPGNRITWLHDGEACFPALLAAIAEAEREILIEMYWFDSDNTGRSFATALAQAARRGVDVRVVYDSVGSYRAYGSMFDDMRSAGCQVYEFNPIAPWHRRFRFSRVNRRNHRKILIFDGRTAFTGGINFADQWAAEADGGGAWRDDMVRIDGPAARALRSLVCEVLPGVGPAFVQAHHMDMQVPACGRSVVRVLPNDYKKHRRAVRLAYIKAIRAAKEAVLIANSYFVPDRAVRRALERAVRRGATVRVLLPGISDVPAVRYASQHLYTRLLERGIQIYEWNDTVLHTKTAVVDRDWCTAGTYNLDYRSWLLNLEVNIVVDDPHVVDALRLRLNEDFERSVAIDLERWRARPLSNRLLEWFFYLFRKLL